MRLDHLRWRMDGYLHWIEDDGCLYVYRHAHGQIHLAWSQISLDWIYKTCLWISWPGASCYQPTCSVVSQLFTGIRQWMRARFHWAMDASPNPRCQMGNPSDSPFTTENPLVQAAFCQKMVMHDVHVPCSM